MDVGARIRELRIKQGLSGNALAKKSGVSQSAINRMENRDQFPTTDTLEKICKALDVTLPEFFSDESTDFAPDVLHLLITIQSLTPSQRKSLDTFLREMKEGK